MNNVDVNEDYSWMDDICDLQHLLSSVKQHLKLYFRIGLSNKKKAVEVNNCSEAKTDKLEEVVAAIDIEARITLVMPACFPAKLRPDPFSYEVK